MPAKEKILVVDDEQGMRFMLSEVLEREGFEAVCAEDGMSAVQKYAGGGFSLVIMDVRMPGMSGLEALEKIKSADENAVVIIVTTYGSEKMGVEAVQKGAYDYFTKPFDIARMRQIIPKAIARRKANLEAKETGVAEEYQFENIIGRCAPMREVFDIVNKVVGTDVTVLICGESGTGKELIARAIHYNGPRKNKPFVEMNCAAIPEALLESELFGHEKGAFTGAESRKPGKFEQADGGTLFLDEVGDMSHLTQAKLLRAIEDRDFERVGGTETVSVDVRIIAATNKNLSEAVEKREFREDLFYRLNVIPVHMPPLRERREDIPDLFDHLMKKFNRKFGKEIREIAVEAMEALMTYSWPGNVRELENILQRAVILAKGKEITREDLPRHMNDAVRPAPAQEAQGETPAAGRQGRLEEVVRSATEVVEKKAILESLEANRWNRTRAAQELGISRKGLHDKMRKYSIGED